MPQIGALLLFTLVSTVLSFAVSTIIGLVVSAIVGKPKRNPLSFDQRTITVRQPVQPRQIIIGENRVGGTIYFLERDGVDVWMGAAWAGHVCQELGDVYLDDTQVVPNSDGSVEGTYNAKLEVYHHSGTDRSSVIHLQSLTDTTDTTSYTTASFTPTAGDLLVVFEVVANSGIQGSVTSSAGITFTRVAAVEVSLAWGQCWVANQLSDGSATTITVDKTGSSPTGAIITVSGVSKMSKAGSGAVRQSITNSGAVGVPPSVTFGAAVRHDNPTIAWARDTANPPTFISPTDWIKKVDIGISTPTLGVAYATRARGFTGTGVTWNTNAAGNWHAIGIEFDASAVIVEQAADTNLKTTFPLKWTDDHQLNGIAHTVFRFVNLATNFDNTVPNMSCDVKGLLAFDPRTGVTGYGDNPAIIARAFIADTDFGLAAPSTEIDAARFAGQANICDEFIDIHQGVNGSSARDWYLVEQNEDFTVNTTTDLTTLGSNIRLFTPDKIYVESTGTLPAPLVAGTAYFWSRVSNTTGGICASIDNANADTRINLTSVGSGTHRIIAAQSRLILAGDETTFTATAATDLVNQSPVMVTMTFNLIVVESTTTLPPPLVAGTKYYYAITSGQSGNVRTSFNGSIIDITGTGSGTHTMRLIGTYHNGFTISTANDTWTASADVFWPTGIEIKLLNSGGALPTVFKPDTIYYWIRTGDAVGKIAASYADALAGIAIDITDAGSGTMGIETTYHSKIDMMGLTTGMRVKTRANSPDPLVVDSEYYWIRRGRNQGQMAASVADALNGIAIELTGPTATGTKISLELRAERRYTCNGVFDTEQDRGETLRALLTSCAGTAMEPLGSGKWRINVGAYRAPIVVLDEGDVRSGGNIQVQTRLPRREAVNTVTGVYVTPGNFDQPADIPAMTDPAYVAEDGGEVLKRDITLPFTNSRSMAVRLARIELRRSRQQRSITFPARMTSAFKVELGDTVSVDLARLGYSDKTFEVGGWNFSLDTSGNDNIPLPAIDLILRETSPSVYSL